MRAVHISTSDIQGGAARAAYRLHRALVEAGQESTMLVKARASTDPTVALAHLEKSPVAQHGNDQARWLQKYYVDTHRSRISNTYFSLPVPGYDLSTEPPVIDADVINLHWVGGLLSPASVGRIQTLNKPVCWTLHDQRAFTGGCHFSANCCKYEGDCARCPQLSEDDLGVAKAGLRESLDGMRGQELVVVCPSKWLAGCARRSVLFSRARIEVIPYSIDTRVFRPRPRDEARGELGLDPQAICFLFGADNFAERRKGFEELSRTFHLCLENAVFRQAVESRRIQWLCFGDAGRYLDNFGAAIHFFGRINNDEQLARVYAAADAFVLSSTEDNLPNTMLESMCCGTPVIGFRIGGIPDAVVTGDTGLLAPEGDCNAFAEAICHFAQHASTRQQLSDNCRREALGRFSMELQAKRYISLYESLGVSSSSGARSEAAGQSPFVPPGPAFQSVVGPLMREAKKERRTRVWRSVKNLFVKK